MSNIIPGLVINLDKFYWGDNNTVKGHKAGVIMSAITLSKSMEPSYVLGAMYQAESNVTQQSQPTGQYTSKATSQYRFQKGIKEFVDER